MLQANLSIKDIIRRALVLGGLVIVASLLLLPWYLETARLSFGHIWNPSGDSLRTLNQVFAYAFRDWSVIFSQARLLIPLGMLLAFYGLFRKPKDPLLPAITTAVILSSFVVFMVSFEIRILAVFQIGLLFGISLLLYDVYRKLREYSSLTFLRALVIITTVVITGAIVVQGNARYFKDSAWYQVVDRQVLQALNCLRLQEGKGIVVAQATPQGNPYMWWIEGYSNHPTFTSSDPKWLNFVQEREQNAVATQLFSAEAKDIDSLVLQYHIEYVFIDKRAPACDPNKFITIGFTVLFENDTVIILQSNIS